MKRYDAAAGRNTYHATFLDVMRNTFLVKISAILQSKVTKLRPGCRVNISPTSSCCASLSSWNRQCYFCFLYCPDETCFPYTDLIKAIPLAGLRTSSIKVVLSRRSTNSAWVIMSIVVSRTSMLLKALPFAMVCHSGWKQGNRCPADRSGLALGEISGAYGEPRLV